MQRYEKTIENETFLLEKLKNKTNNLENKRKSVELAKRQSHEVFHFVQGNFSVSAKKRNEFLLFCSRFFVTLQPD
jgi:hypothetical protein